MLIEERNNGVLHLGLNRPEVRNAFNASLIHALTAALSGITDGDRAVVISGVGEAFCAGGDLNWMREQATQSEAENAADALKLYEMFDAVYRCPVPVIAQVHGPCFGGGCGIVAAADIVVAASNALFAFSEAKLGLVPATISPFVLRKIGSYSRELFVTAMPFDASRGKEIGLVNTVVDEAELEPTVARLLKAILANGPSAVRASKQLAISAPLGGEAAAELLAKTRAGEEAKEGITAFLEKRKANFGVAND
jgi:enoyl-CoA hydratase/carnithine racemase